MLSLGSDLEALADPDCGWFYRCGSNSFTAIPGSPIAYWTSKALCAAFYNQKLGDIVQPKKGLDSADNERFVRNWFELSVSKIGFGMSSDEARHSKRKWFPLNSGGQFRKWYGNFISVVNWENDGAEMKAFPKAYIRAKDFYFSEALSWTKISSGKFSIRYAPQGFVFDSAGQSIFGEKLLLKYVLGFTCSEIAYSMLKILNPTMNYQVGDIANLPIVEDAERTSVVEAYVTDAISLSKTDWDSFESSWDFKRHPLI